MWQRPIYCLLCKSESFQKVLGKRISRYSLILKNTNSNAKLKITQAPYVLCSQNASLEGFSVEVIEASAVVLASAAARPMVSRSHKRLLGEKSFLFTSLELFLWPPKQLPYVLRSGAFDGPISEGPTAKELGNRFEGYCSSLYGRRKVPWEAFLK